MEDKEGVLCKVGCGVQRMLFGAGESGKRE